MALELEVQLRDYAFFLREEAGVIEADTLLARVAGTRPPGRPRPPRRKWLIAVAATAIALILVGGLALIAGLLRTETPVVDEPDPTIQTLEQFDPADIPSFQAMISSQSGVTDGVPSSESTVQISYSAGERKLRLEFLEDQVLGGDPFTKAGSYSIWDGSETVELEINEDESAFRLWGPNVSLEPPSWNDDWKEQCQSEDLEVLESEAILGRDTLHVRCVVLRGEWELWVDEQTGLILRLNGRYDLGVGNVTLYIQDDGGFEMTSLEFVEPAENAFDTTPPPGVEVGSEFEDRPEVPAGLPAFHLVVREAWEAWPFEEESGRDIEGDFVVTTHEVWYQSRQRWRTEVVESTSPWESAGSFSVQMGPRRGRYSAADHTHFVDSESPELPAGVGALIPGFNILGDRSTCTQLEDDTYLGRPVSTFECPMPGGLMPETAAFAAEQGRSENVIFLVDQEFDVILSEVGPGGDRQVLEIEFNPTFDPTLFEFEPPEGSHDRNEGPPPSPLIGQATPALEASYVDGTPFDLADLSGRRTVLMVWATWCGPCLDTLEDFESAYELWGDEIEFIAIAWQDEQANIEGVVERGLQVPVVVVNNDDFGTDWYIEGIPWMALIDADGTIIDVRLGRQDDLFGVIANAAW